MRRKRQINDKKKEKRMKPHDSIKFNRKARVLGCRGEAWMEVLRVFLEKKSLTLLRRWLEEWSRRKINYEQMSAAPPQTRIAQPAPASRFRDLQSSFAALGEAFDEFRRAFEDNNQPLLVRWLEEWRARREHYRKLIVRWLTDYPETSPLAGKTLGCRRDPRSVTPLQPEADC
jgi:hypothetical protein